MKSIYIYTFCILLFLGINSIAQNPKNLVMKRANYDVLMNKDIKTVMKELKLNAKDTIGKTGTMHLLNRKPENEYFFIKTKDGSYLGFKNNILKAVAPSQD